MNKNHSSISLASRYVEAANRFIVQRLRDAGYEDIAPCHGDVLVLLFAHDGCAMKDLAQSAHRSKSTVTALVDRLEAGGYVRRCRSTRDARAWDVCLTERGEALRPVFKAISQQIGEAIETQLGSERTEQLEQLLEQAQRIF